MGGAPQNTKHVLRLTASQPVPIFRT